jgi:hypothetical protein
VSKSGKNTGSDVEKYVNFGVFRLKHPRKIAGFRPLNKRVAMRFCGLIGT